MYGSRISVIQGDITQLDVECVVNAANSTLLGGGGVDGAIHRAAGPDLVHECQLLGGCNVGEAKATDGYGLKASKIIHTVGPIFQTGRFGEAKQLRSCYDESLRLAESLDLKTLAFPCISTGTFDYPKENAAEIATVAVKHWLREHALPEQVIFCCYEAIDFDIYTEILGGNKL